MSRSSRNIDRAIGSDDSGPAVPAVPPACPGVVAVSLSRRSPTALKLVTKELRAVVIEAWSTPIAQRLSFPERTALGKR